MFAIPKPARGSALAALHGRSHGTALKERRAKRAVIARDGLHRCRLLRDCVEPDHETAHIQCKGIGGDHGIRSTTANMIRSCREHHRGRHSLHSGDLTIECLTDRGADGPIVVWSWIDYRWTIVKDERDDL